MVKIIFLIEFAVKLLTDFLVSLFAQLMISKTSRVSYLDQKTIFVEIFEFYLMTQSL